MGNLKYHQLLYRIQWLEKKIKILKDRLEMVVVEPKKANPYIITNCNGERIFVENDS